MSYKTIAKFSCFVILAAIAAASAFSCSHVSSQKKKIAANAAVSQDYDPPKVLGSIQNPDVTESSGLAVSRCNPDVFWTHNDSGDSSFIFAFAADGKTLGTWSVSNAKNADWEDIDSYKDASGKCFLYIGEIGNNQGERPQQGVYRIPEPAITPESASSGRKDPLATEPAEMLRFTYPDAPHDAETMMVHPKTGDIYVLTKRVDGPSLVFRVKPSFNSAEPARAEKVAELAVPSVPNGLLTGGAISADGTRAVICDYSSAYEIVLPGAAANFDEIWKQKPSVVNIGDRKQGEAIDYSADGRIVIATSEKKNSPIFAAERK
jgi:hypothetical protein